jgi:hypothetical protein
MLTQFLDRITLELFVPSFRLFEDVPSVVNGAPPHLVSVFGFEDGWCSLAEFDKYVCSLRVLL